MILICNSGGTTLLDQCLMSIILIPDHEESL